MKSRSTHALATETEIERQVQERTARLTAELAEHHQTEDKLRRSEYLLRKSQEVARLGSYVFDINTGYWVSSPVLRQVFGIDESYVTNVDGWINLIAPDQRGEMVQYLQQHVIGGGHRFEKEYRIVRHNDHEERWVSGQGELEFDAAGHPTVLIGTIQDITDRKRAEMALRTNEEKYRRLTEEISDVIWEMDAASRFTYVSPAYERLCGYRPDEVIGHEVFSLLDEASQREIRSLIEEASRDSALHPWHRVVEVQLKRKEGGSVWIEASAMAFRDKSGALLGYRGMSRDITDRKRIEEELRESQARLTYERDQLNALLEASPDAIYFKDLKSRLVRVSRSKALKMINGVPALRAEYQAQPGIDPIALVTGITDFDTYAREDAQRAFDDEQTVIRTGIPIVNRLEKQIFKDGSVIWHLTNRMPWRDKSGTIIGTFGVSKDVTDLKRAEEDLARLNKQLVEASRQAGMAEVATGVLHNVGNALNSVNVSATLALEQIQGSRASFLPKVSALLQKQAEDLAAFLTTDPRGRKLPSYLASLGETIMREHETLARELDELRTNIDHIKEIVAMQQNYAKLSGILEPVAIDEVVDDALRMNSAGLARHEVELIREYAARPVITTDRHKVLQILVNLLRNAKYACDEAARPDKRVVVRITENPGTVTVAVADNGIGIPEENLVRIFSHGFTTRRNGHGFGLHSSALAARELGGSLAVESAGKGKGATFLLQLPREAPSVRGTTP